MTGRPALRAAGTAGALAIALAGCQAQHTGPQLRVSDAYVQLPSRGAVTAFVTITNEGSGADRLTGVSTPAAAQVRIDRTTSNDRTGHAVQDLGLPAHQTVRVEPPYGLQLVLVGTHGITAGKDIQFTVRFATSRPVTIMAQVVTPDTSGGSVGTA